MKRKDFLRRMNPFFMVYLLAFVFILISDSIGQFKMTVGPGMLIIFPIFYALFLGLLVGPNTLKIIDDKQVKIASKLVGIAILPFVAKLGINAGANIGIIATAGPALILQELGNLGTIFIAMPMALLLGLKREAVGATHSINRESNLALMQDMYGADSPEAQGSLSVYIVGGMVGTIYFGFMASMAAATGAFHPYALGMASGVGAGIMMSSAVAALTEVMPAWADQIAAMASASETLSGIDGIYLAIFVGIPICNWLYKKLEPKIGRLRTKEASMTAREVEKKTEVEEEEEVCEY